MRDRVVIIGDVTSGFRIHGLFEDNAEAFAYVARHRRTMRFPADWDGNAQAVKLMNLDTMTEADVSEYAGEVGNLWATGL